MPGFVSATPQRIRSAAYWVEEHRFTNALILTLPNNGDMNKTSGILHFGLFLDKSRTKSCFLLKKLGRTDAGRPKTPCVAVVNIHQPCVYEDYI